MKEGTGHQALGIGENQGRTGEWGGGTSVPPASANPVFAALAATLCTILAPCDRDVLLVAADALEPPDRSPPSVWAERRVVLSSDQAARVGRLSSDYKPFTRDVQDALYFEPQKLGTIGVKHAQSGWTQTLLNELACLQMRDPGPMLVLAPTKDKAKEYCYDRLYPIVRDSAQIYEIVDRGSKGKYSVGYGVNFAGGKVKFGWASSENSVIGSPFRCAYIDDAEACLDEYPAGKGDLFVSAETRLRTFKGGGGRRMCINGHPRFEHEGLHKLWETRSDRRIWSIDCPVSAGGCGGVFPMHWRCVKYGKMGDDGRPDPKSATLRCPHCDRALSDDERARELWPSRERRKTRYGDLVPELPVYGSGRFVSELEDDVAREREYIGLQITILCDPDVSLVSVAKKLHEAGDDQATRMDLLNKEIGVAAPRHGEVAGSLSDALLDELLLERETQRTGGGGIIVPADVEFVTVGVDVQMGPTGMGGPNGLYIVAVAWARSKMAYVVDARLLVGLDALIGLYLPSMRVCVAETGEQLPVSWCGIDAAGTWTTSVLETCRQSVYAEGTGSRIGLVALRYDPRGVDPSQPLKCAPDNKRQHPTRPELGLVEYYYAHRHSWVDRTHRRFTEKRVRMLCPEPDQWRVHMNANFLGPVKKQHGWSEDRLEWDKAKQARDDWARAFDYAEIAACAKMDLDAIHLRSGRWSPDRGPVMPEMKWGVA